METNRWDSLQSHFLRARELDPDEREAFLKERCGDDAEMLEEVLGLLRLEEALPPLATLPNVAPASATPTQGSQVGVVLQDKIRLDGILGRGGMGVVFEATHLGLDRPVAVKLLSESALGSPRAHDRFAREYRALGMLRHDNIVGILDHGQFHGQPYMVMERITGVDLQRWVEHARDLDEPPRRGRDLQAFLREQPGQTGEASSWGRPYWEIVAAMLAKVARALAAAHEQQIVHRDVKPSNILVTGDGKPMLTDFGLVAILGEESLASRSGPLGTLAYMAPEQLRRGAERLDPRIDVYGLGATLYHLLTFETPFRGSAAEVAAQLSAAVPTAPRVHAPDLPRDLEAICLRAMEKRPADRYASAEAMAEDLDAFVERRPVSARHPTVFGRVARWCHRRPAWAAAAALAALLVPTATAAGVLAHGNRVEARERSEREEFADLNARLPAVFTLQHHPGRSAEPYREPAYVGAQLDRLLEIRPDDAALRFYRASYRSQRDDPEGATADFDAIARRFPAYDTPLLGALADVLTQPEAEARWALPRAGDLPESATDFDDFLLGYVSLRWKDYAAAYDHLTHAVEAAPERWRYRDLRVIAAFGSNRLDEAEEEADGVEQLLGAETARTCHIVSCIEAKSGKFESAARRAERALELCPDQQVVCNTLGWVYSQQERFAEAMEILYEGLAMRPEGAKTRLQLAGLLRDRREFQEADDLLLEGIPLANEPELRQLGKQRASIHLWWGWQRRQERLHDEALVHFDKAQELLTEHRLTGSMEHAFLRAFTGELTMDEVADSLYGVVASIQKRGKHDQAGAYFAYLGWALREAERDREAEVCLRTALASRRCPSFVLDELRVLEAEQKLAAGEPGAALEYMTEHPAVFQGKAAPRAQELAELACAELPIADRESWEQRIESLNL